MRSAGRGLGSVKPHGAGGKRGQGDSPRGRPISIVRRPRPRVCALPVGLADKFIVLDVLIRRLALLEARPRSTILTSLSL